MLLDLRRSVLGLPVWIADIVLEDVLLKMAAQVSLVVEQILLQGAWNTAVELFIVAKVQLVL